jgi:hypothetical protein
MLLNAEIQYYNPSDSGSMFLPRPDRLWGPTQPPIQWVPGALSPRLKRRGVKLNRFGSGGEEFLAYAGNRTLVIQPVA